MAVFRKIEVKFWSDPFVENLTPEQKYFYLYLLTNEKTTQCGIYECTIRKMSVDTGYNQETVQKLIDTFTKYKKIIYSKSTNEVCMLNWLKYNDSNSPKVQKCIENELEKVKNRVLIQYLYSMDIETQEEKEKEKEEEEVKTKEKKELFIESDFFKQTFERLWICYGRKGSKKDSLIQVKKLNENDLKAFCECEPHILDYVEKYKDEPIYRKDFERYISSKYWESEIFKNKQQKSRIESMIDLQNKIVENYDKFN